MTSREFLFDIVRVGLRIPKAGYRGKEDSTQILQCREAFRIYR